MLVESEAPQLARFSASPGSGSPRLVGNAEDAGSPGAFPTEAASTAIEGTPCGSTGSRGANGTPEEGGRMCAGVETIGLAAEVEGIGTGEA